MSITRTSAPTYAEQQAAILATLQQQAAAYEVLTIEDLTTPAEAPTARIGLVTPQIALEVLTHHHASNRQVSLASKDAYLRDMLAGKWAFNGQTCVFDTSGKMIDAQHRFGALAETVKTMPEFPGLPFVIVTGVDISAQETMDGGRKRSVADQLNIGQSEKMGTKIVAALRALYLLGNAASGGKLGGGKLTNAMLFEMFRLHKGITKSVQLAYSKDGDDNTMQVRPAVVAAIHYAAHHILPGDLGSKADSFVEVLRSGKPTEGYTGADPAHALYVRWGQMSNLKRPSENDALKLVAAAWSLYAEDKPASPKAFAKVPVVLEPIGFNRTDVTGEALNLPVSSQPEPDHTPAGAVANGKSKSETPEQLAARRKAASDKMDDALAKKKAARAKGKAKGTAKSEPEAVQGEPEAVQSEPEAAQSEEVPASA